MIVYCKPLPPQGLGIALKLTLSGNNQMWFTSTWFFIFFCSTCIILQMNYLNKVCHDGRPLFFMLYFAKLLRSPSFTTFENFFGNLFFPFRLTLPGARHVQHSCGLLDDAYIGHITWFQVSPIYYVIFTTFTIIASSLLFNGWGMISFPRVLVFIYVLSYIFYYVYR
jgi:hypothetical protein